VAAPPKGGPATTAPKSPPTTITPTQSTIPQNLPKEAAPTREVGCPSNVPPSPAGGRVRCYQVTGGGSGTVSVVGIPGIPVPLPLPVPVNVAIGNDTGDSGSNDVNNRVTVYVDVDNPQVVDGDAYARAGQRALATILLLLGLPVAAVAIVLLLRRRRGGGGAPPAGPGGWPAPPGAPGGPPPAPGPGGTWVYYPPGSTPTGVPPPDAPHEDPGGEPQ
jgi:hypothetical protein